MKKKLILLALVCLTVISAYSQVEFSKFKLGVDNPMGAFPGRKMLDTKFKVTSEKGLKYIYVDWYMVNEVGDVVSGVTRGTKSDDEEFIKPKIFQMTGPYESGKSYSRWASAVGYAPSGNKATAFPYQLRIMYMGTNEMITIPITKENISKYFPKVKWMDINRYNNAL